MPESSEEIIASLTARLAEATAREGEFRLKSAQDFLEFEKRLAAQVQAIAERDAKVHQLHLEAAERDGYVHRLHLEQIELKKAVQALHTDLEALTWMLEKAGNGGLPAAGSPDAPPAKFVYYLHTPPFRIYRGERFTLRGWVLPEDGRKVTSIRARVDDRAYAARIGLPEPEVIASRGPQANHPQPGFEVEFETPPGRHRLRLEAQLDGQSWHTILALPIWSQRGA